MSCPRCGLSTARTIPSETRSGWIAYCVCLNCGAETPGESGASKAEAVRKALEQWNRMPRRPAQFPRGEVG